MRGKKFYVAALVGAAALTLAGCGGGGGAASAPSVPSSVASGQLTTPPATGEAPSTANAGLTAEENAALRYMREEEKLAHDVYAALHAKWGLQVFSSIADSESQHTESILTLLEKYEVEDPAAGKAAGQFEDPALQALYDKLVALGSVSEIEALKVGALIEETDIRDIDEKKAITDNADIVKVYDQLLCGSGNHLRAFNKQLLSRGVTYVPQVITQSQWDAVAAGTDASCSG